MTRFAPDGSAHSNTPSFGAAFRAGSFPAVEQLIAGYGARAYAIARDVLQVDEAAQDAASESLRLLLEERGKAPDQIGATGAWWLAATRRSALDRQRGRLAQSGSIADYRPEQPQDVSAIRPAVQELPNEYREVLSLIVLEGRTLADVMRLLGLSAQEAVTRLNSAMRRLQAALTDPAERTPPVRE